MNTDSVLQAILLLCSFFNKNDIKNIKPLTPTEYSRLAMWLHHNKYTPADFLTQPDILLNQWLDPKPTLKNAITQERLAELLQRSASMGFALEKWQQQQVWVLSRASEYYPKILKETLGDTRSPLLFGIGNKELLNTSGIGFVGSRDTNSDDESFTQSLAEQAVEQGFTVVSGGARGVDQTSMLAALDAGGKAIGILADSLLKSATKAQYRKALQEGRLLLITPYYPEAGFSPGNAMGRNKYIYSLSKGVVVAKSDEKGGTWSGATENLRKQWVPLWVRDLDHAGNQKLIALGGQKLSESTNVTVDFTELQFNSSVEAKTNHKSNKAAVSKPLQIETQADVFTDDLFSSPQFNAVEQRNSPQEKSELELELKPEPELKLELEEIKDSSKDLPTEQEIEQPHKPLSPFLDLFYQQLLQQKDLTHKPKALAEANPELSETIIKAWLKVLDDQGLVKREGKKLAYTLITSSSQTNED
jgi:predicted Rossmann fold nucleotide-binding protein DprA/Smf involved in DNA uptake